MAFYLVNASGIRGLRSVSSTTVASFRAAALTMRTFIVGEGEAILLYRQGEAVLFDGGAVVKKVNEPLGRALIAYLAQENLKLEAIVATHPHTDHLNALSTILAGADPPAMAADGVLYHNGETMGTWLTETLGERMATLSASGRLAVEAVTAGAAGHGIAGVEMLHFVDGRSKPSTAYKSIWTLAWFGDASFLFTGDAYDTYEAQMLASPIAGLLPSHVLKITHHGSEHGTSQDFVDFVQPRLSVASTAASAGHRLETIIRERLRKVGRVFDTDTAGGDIVLRTDGKTRTIGSRTGVMYEVVVEKDGWYLGATW